MLFVLVLDGAGYLMAVDSVPDAHAPLIAALEDIFVVVALLTISVGIVLPGMITHSATEVSNAAKRLTSGTLNEFSHAMAALGRGDLDAAHASVNIVPVTINSNDELGEMAESFNVLQDKVKEAAHGLDEARENMHAARTELLARHAEIAHLAHHDPLTDLPNRTALARALCQHPRAGESLRRQFCRSQHRPRQFQGGQRCVRPRLRGRTSLCNRPAASNGGRRGFYRARGRRRIHACLSHGEQPAGAEVLADRLFKSAIGRLRNPRTTNLYRDEHGRGNLSEGRKRCRDAHGQCRRRSLPGQGGWPRNTALLRSRNGQAIARALRVAA